MPKPDPFRRFQNRPPWRIAVNQTAVFPVSLVDAKGETIIAERGILLGIEQLPELTVMAAGPELLIAAMKARYFIAKVDGEDATELIVELDKAIAKANGGMS